MDQHAFPRQITSFEFKLIGFMTLKQFLYLAIFFPLAYLVYSIVPVPIVNILLAVIVGGAGLAFAFIPIQDRPLEVWLRNLIKRINSPTQYMYHKKNNPVGILSNLYFVSDPHLTVTHVDTKEKLNAYLATQNKTQNDLPLDAKRRKQEIHVTDLLSQTKNTDPSTIKKSGSLTQGTKDAQQVLKQPFVSGTVKNRRNIALPGILVTIKSSAGEQLRLLKTNPHGIFATYSPLSEGEYIFEASDPNGNYFFDTMNMHITKDQQNPIMLYSKEIL